MPADKKDFIQDNPVGHDWSALKDDGRRFRVGTGAVGAHAEGAIVSIKSLGQGAQVQRLIDLGLITEVDPVEPGTPIDSPMYAQSNHAQGTLASTFAGPDPHATTGSPHGPAPTTIEPVPAGLALNQPPKPADAKPAGK